ALLSRGTLGALRTATTPRPLGTHVSLRALETGITPVALRPLKAPRSPAIRHVARAVVIHVLGGEVTLVVLVEIPAAHAIVTLRAIGRASCRGRRRARITPGA